MDPIAYTSPASSCDYLPDQQRRIHYLLQPDLRPDAYMIRLRSGWRRFGPVLFRPDCDACRSCQSLRVPTTSFRPSASQRRVWNRNEGEVELRIGSGSITSDRVELFSRFHSHGHATKGWPTPDDAEADMNFHLLSPIPIEEWSYWIDGRLVGIGYLDSLPDALSAIYFVHDPAEHRRSLGTFNVLKIIEAARVRKLPQVYLGYFVAGCRSLEYKANFRPNEILTSSGWEPFKG